VLSLVSTRKQAHLNARYETHKECHYLTHLRYLTCHANGIASARFIQFRSASFLHSVGIQPELLTTLQLPDYWHQQGWKTAGTGANCGTNRHFGRQQYFTYNSTTFRTRGHWTKTSPTHWRRLVPRLWHHRQSNSKPRYMLIAILE
jgi:hypothetical protein